MALLTQLLSMKASHFMSEAAIAVDGICIQIFFDTEELVVLSHTFASCRSASLDLSSVQSDGNVCDGGICGFTRAVGNDSGIACALCHLYCFEGFGQGTDLVQLDQNGIRYAHVNALGKAFGIGDEEIIADELDFAAETVGQFLPAFPVLFSESVFNGDDRVLVDQVFIKVDHFLCGLGCVIPSEMVEAVIS